MTKLAQSTSLLADGVAHPSHGVAALARSLAELIRGRSFEGAGTPAPADGDDLQWLSLSTDQQDATNTDRGMCHYALLQLESDLVSSLPGTDRYM